MHHDRADFTALYFVLAPEILITMLGPMLMVIRPGECIEPLELKPFE